MMKNKFFREDKHFYDQFMEILPEELKESLYKDFDLDFLFGTTVYINPSVKELEKTLQKLIIKQFPEFSRTGDRFLLQCINDISSHWASSLSIKIYMELLFIDAGGKRSKNNDEYQWNVKHYARKHEIWQGTIDDYPEYRDLPDVEKEEMVKMRNEENIVFCNQYNQMKTEFLEVVQPILSKYYGKQLDKLNNEDWEHYDLVVGVQFHNYRQDCLILIYSIEDDLITGNTGMNYYEFVEKVYMKS